MRAQKILFTLRVEVLDHASIPAMVNDAMQQVENEATAGEIRMKDGDLVVWSTTEQSIQF